MDAQTIQTHSTRPAGPVAALRGFLAALVVLYAALSGTGAAGSLLPASSSHWALGALLLLASALCGLRAIAVRDQRPVWAVVALGLGSWGVGEALFASMHLLGGAVPEWIANGLSLGFYPAAFLAVALMLRARMQTFFTTLWLDGLAGALSVCALVAAFVFPPVLAHAKGSTLHVVGDLSYPLADLLLVACGLFAMAMTSAREVVDAVRRPCFSIRSDAGIATAMPLGVCSSARRLP